MPQYNKSVFLSYPRPMNQAQVRFIDVLRGILESQGFAPRTLGVTDYDLDAPLTAIRRLMLESNGIITVAFRRVHLGRASLNHGSDIPDRPETDISGKWLTSPWAHIEPAMAFQLGLPILILREKGVLDDGVLEKGVTGVYMPEFDVESTDSYWSSTEWNALLRRWTHQVETVFRTKGDPPQLY
jgi:hypothetical protein